MWDKPTWLNWLANSLLAISLVAMLYAALFAVVHLPIFPLREVVVEGQFVVLKNDPYGLYYRMTDAIAIK